MLRNQSAWSPRADATWKAPSISSYCSGVTRARPDFRPVVVSSKTNRP